MSDYQVATRGLGDDLQWRKSTRSGSNAGACVEVAKGPKTAMALRDSKLGNASPILWANDHDFAAVTNHLCSLNGSELGTRNHEGRTLIRWGAAFLFLEPDRWSLFAVNHCVVTTRLSPRVALGLQRRHITHRASHQGIGRGRS